MEGKISGRRKTASELGLRLGDWIPRRLGKSEELGLAYLLPWSEWSAGSQGVLLELGAGIKHSVRGGG